MPPLPDAPTETFSAAGPNGSPRILTADEMWRLERDNMAAALESANGRVHGPGGAAAVLGMKAMGISKRGA